MKKTAQNIDDTNKPSPDAAGKKATKGEVTRERILLAARKVFAEHPYNAASFRMIGKEGVFDHPLINYYFPRKADLFEAVVMEICEEFYQANLACFEGLETMLPGEGFSLYLDRFLDFNIENPEPLRIIMLNVAQVDRLDKIPGYQHIPEVMARTRKTFEERANLKASPKDIGMFQNSFNALVFFYLGASSCQAEILGMNPSSDEYLRWVKDTLMYLFLPRLEKLIFPDET
jgi:AcrR family transcriptional regulator